MRQINMNKSIFLIEISLLAFGCSSKSPMADNTVNTKRPVIVCKETHTYKQLGDLDIEADVFRFLDDKIRPVIVNIHGGGWMIGDRTWVGDFQYQTSIDRGSVLVSIDYRLAPQTKMPEIMEDVLDAIDWVRRVGPKKFNIDPNQIVLMGESAGAFSALMCSYMLTPPPAAIVSLGGAGKLPESPRRTPNSDIGLPYPGFKLPTEEEALNELKLEGPKPRTSRPDDSKYFWYTFLVSGKIDQDVFGFDPKMEPERSFPFVPVKNVSPAFPPTIQIHAGDEQYFPIELVTMLVDEFEKHGVPNELIVVEGATHVLANLSREDLTEVTDQVAEWIMQTLNNLNPDLNPN